jgi:hypothetical protein
MPHEGFKALVTSSCTHPQHCDVGWQLLPAKEAPVLWTVHKTPLPDACCAEGVSTRQCQRPVAALVEGLKADTALKQTLHAGEPVRRMAIVSIQLQD